MRRICPTTRASNRRSIMLVLLVLLLPTRTMSHISIASTSIQLNRRGGGPEGAPSNPSSSSSASRAVSQVELLCRRRAH
jgi:hypothetical protein